MNQHYSFPRHIIQGFILSTVVIFAMEYRYKLKRKTFSSQFDDPILLKKSFGGQSKKESTRVFPGQEQQSSDILKLYNNKQSIHSKPFAFRLFVTFIYLNSYQPNITFWMQSSDGRIDDFGCMNRSIFINLKKKK